MRGKCTGAEKKIVFCLKENRTLSQLGAKIIVLPNISDGHMDGQS